MCIRDSFNTASEVGYGNVIASLPAFLVVKNAVLGISENPLISEAVAVNVLAGITGSASGGMSIAPVSYTHLDVYKRQNRPIAGKQI